MYFKKDSTLDNNHSQIEKSTLQTKDMKIQGFLNKTEDMGDRKVRGGGGFFL